MTTSNLNSPTHVYTSGGIYTITLVGISTSYGCIDSVSQVFIIDTTPVPQISSSLLYGCAPLTINFNNTSIYSNFYSWNFGDGNTSALEFPSNLYNLPGTYTVTFIAENIFQCKDTTQLHILVNPRPIASFTISPFECTYPATVDFINNSSGAISYSWNFGDGNGFSSTVQNPSMTYENPNQYPITLISSNIFGCLDTTFNTVIVCPLFTFYLPSAFSPNGDLMNDEFFGEGLGIKDFQMDIFDRWGNLVFHTDEIKNHWDGTYKGRMVQEDVYVYKINLTDIFFSPHKYIGKITVVR